MKTVKFISLRLLGLGYNLTGIFVPHWTGKQLFKIFTSPPRVRIRAKEQDFLEKASIDRFTLKIWGGVVYQWGDSNRPYVLLSYGWGYNAGRWRHYVPQLLAAGYRVIAYDPPGHGHAAKGNLNLADNVAIIRHLLRSFGPPKFMLGHSFGGGSMVYALTGLPRYYHPSRIVLMAAFSKASWIFRYFKYSLGLSQATYQYMIKAIESHIDRKISDFDVASLSNQLSHTSCLIVHDPEDKVTHFRNALRYQQYWPDSQLLSVEDAGHHLGNAEVTHHIISFILRGIVPDQALDPVQTLSPDHELVRFFAGMETGFVERQIKVP